MGRVRGEVAQCRERKMLVKWEDAGWCFRGVRVGRWS